MEGTLHGIREQLTEMLAKSAELHRENKLLRAQLKEALTQLEEAKAVSANDTARSKDARSPELK